MTTDVPPKRRRVVAAVLGAVLMAVVGATAGSWIGGRDLTALPGDAEALALAQEIVPGDAPAGGTDRRDYGYGSRLGDESYGPGFVEVRYQPETEEEIEAPPVCGTSLRSPAAARGWQHFRDLTGYPCDSWSAVRENLVVDYTHDVGGPVVTFYRATPPGVGAGTLLGAVLGALIGAAVFHALRGHRLLLPLGVPAAAVCLVAAAIVGGILLAGGYNGPTPPFWTVWPSLAGLLVPL